METKVGMNILFEYCSKKYEIEIQEITIIRNQLWIGDLGYEDNIHFWVHGDLDLFGNPVDEWLVVRFDYLNRYDKGYLRHGIYCKLAEK